MSCSNVFAVLHDSDEFVPVKKSKEEIMADNMKKQAKKEMNKEKNEKKKAKKEEKRNKIISDFQSIYVLITWSGVTRNEFVIGNFNYSWDFGDNYDKIVRKLEKIVDGMGFRFSCSIWLSSIRYPVLKKLVDNQYELPDEYKPLHKLVCNKITIMKDSDMLVFDIRYPHLQYTEITFLRDHSKVSFGKMGDEFYEEYRKHHYSNAELNGITKYFDTFVKYFNFEDVYNTISEFDHYHLTDAEKIFVEFRKTEIEKLEDAKSVFEKSNADVFKRFKSFEELKNEIEYVKTLKKELYEKLAKLRKEHEHVKIVEELNSDEAFPSL